MKKFVAAAGIALATISPSVAEQTPLHTIAVMGEGEVRVAPDFATIEVGVITQGPRVADALADNSTKMNKVVQALRDLGIADRDIQTSNFQVQPKYEKTTPGDYDDSEMRAIVGYFISNKVTVTVNDLSKVAKIIDATIVAGANASGLVTFHVRHVTELMDQAREAAAASALHKAKILTTALHLKLGRALSVTDNQANTSYNGQAGMDVETVIVTAERREAPILPNEITLTSQVTVVYEAR